MKVGTKFWYLKLLSPSTSDMDAISFSNHLINISRFWCLLIYKCFFFAKGVHAVMATSMPIDSQNY